MSDDELWQRARGGDRRAQSAILRAAEPGVRRVVRLLVGQPDDVDDLVQEVLLQAFAELGERSGGADFGAHVEGLAVRRATEFLALQRRWRPAAQLLVEDLCESHGMLDEVAERLAAPELRLHTGTHVAFCFSVVGRSLPLQEQTALVLCDVLGLPTRRAAEVLQAREEDVERFLAQARAALDELYGRLCGLVSEAAPCDQCRGLWAAARGDKGAPPDKLGLDTGQDAAETTPETRAERLRRRLRVVREADLDRGPMRPLHDFLYRLLAENEHNRTTPRELDDRLPAARFRWAALAERNN